MQKVLIQAKEENYYELFLLEFATGLRLGELMALQWDDVDLVTGELRINKQVNLVGSKDEYQTLIKIMQRRGQRKEEPLDDVLITASPALLKTSIIMLLQEGVFSRREFMEELSSNYNLSIKPEEVEYLLDLPVGTLVPPKVVAFSPLQIKQQGK